MAQFFGQNLPRVGFDPGPPGAVPWQMVPLNGSRPIVLLNGDGLSLNAARNALGTGGVTLRETRHNDPRRREIVIEGTQAGIYEVSAGAPESHEVNVMLYAQVFPERVVRIAYYFLPGAQRWDANELNNQANNIFLPQANVRVEFLGSWDSTTAPTINLPRQLNLLAPGLSGELRKYGNHARANLLVYFGGSISGEFKNNDTNAQTLGDQTIIDSGRRSSKDIEGMARTLAHEIGHFVSDLNGPSHDEKPTDLMFTPHTNGTQLRRERIQRIIR
jgi:hypothetical protein